MNTPRSNKIAMEQFTEGLYRGDDVFSPELLPAAARAAYEATAQKIGGAAYQQADAKAAEQSTTQSALAEQHPLDNLANLSQLAVDASVHVNKRRARHEAAIAQAIPRAQAPADGSPQTWYSVA